MKLRLLRLAGSVPAYAARSFLDDPQHGLAPAPEEPSLAALHSSSTDRLDGLDAARVQLTVVGPEERMLKTDTPAAYWTRFAETSPGLRS